MVFGQFGVVGIAVLLFPLLKPDGEALALAHIGFRVTRRVNCGIERRIGGRVVICRGIGIGRGRSVPLGPAERDHRGHDRQAG